MSGGEPASAPSPPEDNAFKNCYIPKDLPSFDEVLKYVSRQKEYPRESRPYQPTPKECTWRPAEVAELRSPEQNEYNVPDQDSPKKSTFMSFGDNGTTVTVTENGQLMQISRYLGPGRSSIFTLDYEEVNEPMWVSGRAAQLHDLPERFYELGSYYETTTVDKEISESSSFLRNRWPRCEALCPDWSGVTQWLVHDGVAIAQDVIRNTSNVDLKFNFGFLDNMLIRELDFVNTSYTFNEERDTRGPRSNYASAEGPGGLSFLTVHKFTGGEAGNGNETSPKPRPEAVGLVLGIFFNGEPQRWKDFENGKEFTIKAGSSLDFTVGHKLVLLSPDKLDWRSLVLTADQVDVDRILAETRSPFFEDDGLDYATRRHVEHILSVCTIPVTPTPVWDHALTGAASSIAQKDSIVALTCGDMAGHRVFPSASYFAFKFLITVAEHLRRHNPRQSASLIARIHETCKAHLRWVFKQLDIKDRSFAHNYWVSGREIEVESYLRSDCPTDTPYQILKAFAYYQHCENDQQEKDFVVNLLQSSSSRLAMSWVEKLDEENKRDSYAWRHSTMTDIVTFRLDDHVWIWKTLRAVSRMLDWDGRIRKPTRTRDRRDDRGEALEEKAAADLMKKYEPGRVLREITRRFTTENGDSAQRMLAVTRSARENRFLFHSLDTALFYGLHGRLSEMDSDVWRATLESQRHQQDNQAMQFANPLRYALALIMASSGFSINRSSPVSVLKTANTTLRSSMMANGLFPGQISELASQNLSDEYYPEFYYRVTFEIPYILWQYRSVEDLKSNHEIGTPAQSEASFQMIPQISSPNTFGLEQTDTTHLRVTVDNNKGGATKLVTTRERPLLKRKVPFGNFTEQNIVDVPEEWLYNYPGFFDFQPPAKTLPWKVLEEQLRDGRYSQVIQDAIKEYSEHRDTDPNDPYQPAMFFSGDEGIFAVDVSKKKSLAKSRAMTTVHMPVVTSLGPLWARLGKPRTAEKAKKRFVSLRPPTRESALVCLLASHPQEMDPVSLFFDHHANHETYFYDEANRVQNTWETEFHTSFFQLSTTGSAAAGRGGAEPLLKPMREALPNLHNRQITRASMGFRIYGDFVDRFWTCHVISSVCRAEEDTTENRLSVSGPKSEIDKLHVMKLGWQQRKILELIQYISILIEMNRSTKEILDTINEKLDVQKGRLSLANLRSEEYFKVSIEWERYGEILEAMDVSFTSVMERISEWENRERDREQEQPRWTKSDERKYRRDINIFLGTSKKKTRELKGHQATVKTLRTALNATQERIRNELDLRGNENIRYFTYATVIFLPLGFAASLFGMQGPPSHLTIRQMVVCAVVGITVTVVFLTSIQRVIILLERLWLALSEAWSRGHPNGKNKSKRGREDTVKDEANMPQPPKFLSGLRQAMGKILKSRQTVPKTALSNGAEEKPKEEIKEEINKHHSTGSEPNYGSAEAV